jgi:death-on-curing protein
MEIKWLKESVVLAIHKRQIAEHGGEDGVRDLGLLSSALARPHNISLYEPESDIAKLASGYAYGICKNHPFIDGNKRTAFVATYIFLELNGYHLKTTLEDEYFTFLKLAEGSLSEKEFIEWIRKRIDTI